MRGCHTYTLHYLSASNQSAVPGDVPLEDKVPIRVLDKGVDQNERDASPMRRR